MLLAEVERALRARRIVRGDEARVVVACSGGRDSVVLAHACAELLGARRVILGHVDHAVRADSGLDRAFVESFASSLGASFAVARLEPGSADEARLRRLRYAALEQMRRSSGARVVLTAHTLDDQAETVLLAIVRSARLGALRGIETSRGRVLRPMLRIPRAEVSRYATANNLAFRDDPTNVEPRYLRNRIRKELLPLLESRYRANTARHLAKLAREVARLALPSSREVPRQTPAEPPGPSVCAIQFERRSYRKEPIPDGKQVALFDADMLQRPLVRATREGDRIQPFGMEGHRKVRDLLRETRVPASARASFPVVADENGEVLWVPGAARSSAYPVTPSTHNVWVFWMNDSDKLQRPLRGVTVEEQDQEE